MIKKLFLPLLLIFSFALPLTVHAGGYDTEGVSERPPKKRYRRRRRRTSKTHLIPPPPSCIPRSPIPKVNIAAWNPKQKAEKILGVLQECYTDQWDVLRILGGPNVINVRYPEEHEQWGYLWLWGYKLKNPKESAIILMDKPGKRIRKGKNPVELYITFNEKDVVERVEMKFIQKKYKKKGYRIGSRDVERSRYWNRRH